MNRLFNARPLLAAAIAIGALAAATAAQARSDVVLSIGVNAPYGYVQPAPVYVQPAPVYVQPEPVYVRPAPVYVRPAPVYVRPAPVYYQPAPRYYEPQPVYYNAPHRPYHRRGAWGDADRDGVPNIRDRDSRFYNGRVAYRPWEDADGDGVANRYDRAPNNPYRH